MVAHARPKVLLHANRVFHIGSIAIHGCQPQLIRQVRRIHVGIQELGPAVPHAIAANCVREKLLAVAINQLQANDPELQCLS